jgi:hypothetical protein
MNFKLDCRAMFHTNWPKMTALYDNVFKHTTNMCIEEAGDSFLQNTILWLHKQQEDDSLATPTILSSLTLQKLIMPEQ